MLYKTNVKIEKLVKHDDTAIPNPNPNPENLELKHRHKDRKSKMFVSD